jgi:hypothetical protein
MRYKVVNGCVVQLPDTIKQLELTEHPEDERLRHERELLALVRSRQREALAKRRK